MEAAQRLRNCEHASASAVSLSPPLRAPGVAPARYQGTRLGPTWLGNQVDSALATPRWDGGGHGIRARARCHRLAPRNAQPVRKRIVEPSPLGLGSNA